MFINKAFKYRIYPSKQQIQQINKTIGCSRYVFNCFLDIAKNNKYNDYKTNSKELTALKNNLLWLKEADKFALQNSLKDLDNAFKRFFKEHTGYPCFKSKHNDKQSYRTNFTNNNIEIRGNFIKLPKLGLMKFKNSRNLEGKLISVTVSKSSTKKYFISVCCEVEIQPIPCNNIHNIGLDLGLKNYITTSDGDKYKNPRTLIELEVKLKRLQRSYSRKDRNSKNQQKTEQKIALLHEKITNIRNDYLQKLSSKIINENQVIVMEDLKIANMLKNHKLAKHIADASWSRFVEFIRYKSLWNDRLFLQVDTFYPSSQQCGVCKSINPIVKNLSIRSWQCPVCNTIHDRDINSAKNILEEGLRQLEIA